MPISCNATKLRVLSRITLQLLFLCLLITLAMPGQAFSVEITPFQTFNQSPLVQIYGLPAAEPATTMHAGRLGTRFSADVAKNFAIDETPNESITLDGETYRITAAGRYGLTDRIEIGVDLPYLVETGGVLGAPIEWFHHVFGLAQDGRDEVPQNRLLFTYTRNGVERFNIHQGNEGFGDIRLFAAFQLYRSDHSRRAIALRSSLKLPSGDSGELHGSGAPDFSLWLSAADDHQFTLGRWGVYGALGGMVVGRGDILPDLQRNLVAFGTAGIGWSPAEWVALKLQINGNTPFYENSSLTELSVTSFQLLFGPSFAFSSSTDLDVSISEHILVPTSSPDFGFQVALRKRF
ncbi:MAG: DUF3187 family protein [Desulfobacteraceae bacterium]|nr:DUF3187 family protein [Desulfobacteraceae bacterium]